MIQHQYWVTKKSVQRKLGGKEDECIVSSDAELDAKLELFRSISESCIHLQRVIDLYQDRLCNLAQEENTLGRYMKECGKNEKNSQAGQILSTAGKALAYMGHQRLTLNSPLVRLHHEVGVFVLALAMFSRILLKVDFCYMEIKLCLIKVRVYTVIDQFCLLLVLFFGF